MEITGYRIVRTLGRGGMATVYLAEQESVQRDVALKVMSATFHGDEEFGARFLREARIAANLRHPNVVQVHDVGVSGENHYIAMEYLPGGPVIPRDAGPRPIEFALRVASQIASALDYASSRGIVHRDIKPDNILLREDGTAVLTDFGIAHASDSNRMTRTGAIVGTPHYMSPEQARGQELDGRADLYSLGIVLYEMLVGNVPYQAADSMAVGIMHITAPLPRLPLELSSFQPVLDRLLAKDPAHRFQRGNDVVSALKTLQQTPIDTKETRVMPVVTVAKPTMVLNDDDEPKLGRLDSFLDEPIRARPSGGKASSSLWAKPMVWVLGLAVLTMGGGLYVSQDNLRKVLPQTRMNTLLEEAAVALNQGRYMGESDSAHALYAAALAIDPDNLLARQGIQEVGRRLVAEAKIALEKGDAAPARIVLQHAESLSLPAIELSDLQRDVRSKDAHNVELGSLLDDARRAADAGHLDGAYDSAVAQYRRVLSIDATNAVALAGLREVLSRLLQKADGHLQQQELEAATQLIERVAAIDVAHLGLPDARARLARAKFEAGDVLESQNIQADALLAQGNMLPPASPNALEIYRKVLAVDGSNVRAQNGVQQIALALIGQASRHVDEHRFEDAAALLEQVNVIAPNLPATAAAQKRLDDVRARREVSHRSLASPELDIPTTLQQARDAVLAGQFLSPPGESAYDLYRAVLAQSPGHAEARSGLAALPDRAMARYDEAMASNRLGTARSALEALSVIDETDQRLVPARQRLASSYLAYATERLGAGELDLARRAFDQARELDPSNTDLPAVQARLEQASGN